MQRRESAFIEKYDGIRYNTEDDTYGILEAELESGNHLVAVINTELLNWSAKSSHPWILKIEIDFDGNSNNGLPDPATYQQLDRFEEEIMSKLNDFDGYLNIGRQTAENRRIIFFACKDFRLPSKVLDRILKENHSKLTFDFDIYKDKYWQSFEKFKNSK